MSETKRCPQCQAEIPAAAPEGLCPQCLLQAGLESKTMPPEPQKTAAYTPSGPGFVPPTPEVLQAAFPQLEILELLGKGGMGAVYKAKQRGLDRLVAVKILPPEFSQDPGFAERFLREAKALAMLSHPNIVGIHDIGQAGGFCYFVMEFVDGVNLRQAMRAGTLKPAEALKIVPQICDALQFAHDEGIVHRDIKPENILLDKKGRVKIADFGLAKLLGKTHDVTLTGTQQVMGTMHYMAPEQIEGARDVDHRADIYSLGVTFYEMLTGELPIGRFAAPSKKVQIDVRLDEVVLHALEKEPEQRYQHASEIKTEVETIASGPVAAPGGPSTAKLDTPISVPYAGVIPTGPFDLGAFGMLHFDGVFLEFEITKSGFFSNNRLQSVRIPLAEVKSMWVEKRKPPGWGVPAPRLWSLYLRTNRMRALDDLPFGRQGQVELFLEPENVAAAQELQKAVSRALEGHQEHAREIKTEVEGIVSTPAAPFAAAGADADARLGLTCGTIFFLALGIISLVFFAINWGNDNSRAGLICGGISLLGLAIMIFSIVRHRRGNTARHGTEQPQPPPPPRRSWFVPVLGVINLLVGLVFLFASAAWLLNPDPVPAKVAEDEVLRPLYNIWRIAEPVFEYVAAMFWFAGGIGLLLWKPWARRVTVATAIFLIAWFVLSIPAVIAFDIQPAFEEIQRDANGDQAALITATTVVFLTFTFMTLIGLTYEIAVIAYLSRPRIVAAFSQEDERPPVDPHDSKALPPNAGQPTVLPPAARLLGYLRSVVLPLVVACGVYIGVFAGVAKAIGEDVAIGTAIGAALVALAAFWVYRKYGFAFLRRYLPYAWTALCLVLFVLLWTPYEAHQIRWSGYLDGTIWPYREITDCAVSLEPKEPTCKRIIIRETEETTRSGYEMVHRNAIRPNRDQKIRLTYDIELLPLKGEPRHLIVDGRNGTAWRADGRSGSILDAVSVAEWLQAGDVNELEAPEAAQKKRQAALALQARHLVDIIQIAFRDPYVFYYWVDGRRASSRLEKATHGWGSALFRGDAFLHVPGWNATESDKWEPVVPILYVGVPLMLAVWGVGLWLLLRHRRASAIKTAVETAAPSGAGSTTAESATSGDHTGPPPHADDPLEQLVIDRWYPGRKIAAIVAYREKTGADLAEAKAAVEKIAEKYRLPGRKTKVKLGHILILIGVGVLLTLILLSPLVYAAGVAAVISIQLLLFGVGATAGILAFGAVWKEWWQSPSPFVWKVIRSGLLVVSLLCLWCFLSSSTTGTNDGVLRFEIGSPSPWLRFWPVPGEGFQINPVSWSTLALVGGWLAFWAYRRSLIESQPATPTRGG